MGGRPGGHTTRAGRFGRASLAVLLLAMLSLGQHWQPPVAHAATFTVNSTLDEHDAVPGNGVCASAAGRCTLRAAIEEANALAGADTISVPAGTYTLTQGDLVIRSEVTIVGAGMDSTFVQAGPQPYSGANRVFRIETAAAVAKVSGLTARNGRTGSATPGTGGFGGGILIFQGGRAVLDAVRVTGNQADAAGGIGVGGGAASLTLSNSIVSSNTAVGDGGIQCASDAGLSVLASLSIVRTSIVSNVATRSTGGIYANDCNLTVSDSLIAQNQAPEGNAGGIQLSDSGSKVLTNVTISANVGANAGGVWFQTQDGGTATLANVTIADNRGLASDAAHAIHVTNAADPAALAVRNTIVTHREPSGPACRYSQLSGPVRSLGGNFEFPGRTCFLSAATSGPADLTNFDPKLLALANNGGPTLTHGLAGTSRAIDRVPFSTGVCPTTDQRGLPRPRDGNGDGITSCDSGAFEAQSPPVGTFTLAPSTANVAVGQRHAAVLTWTVTEGTWHTLKSVQVRLRDEGETGVGDDQERIALQFQWDQDANTVRQVDPQTGRLGPPAALGSETVLESARAALYLKESRIQGGGPTAPNVAFMMGLALKPPAKGRTYAVEVAATNDSGAEQGFAATGTLAIDR